MRGTHRAVGENGCHLGASPVKQMSQPTPSGGLWGRGTAGKLWRALGQSGALSLQGWPQKHGIDGVVMRDCDAEKQTAIQSGTSMGGLLRPILTSSYWTDSRRTDWGMDTKKKRASVQQGLHTSPYHTFIILVCDLSQQPMASKEPTVCVRQRCCDQLLLHATQVKKKKNKTSGKCTYMCHASR